MDSLGKVILDKLGLIARHAVSQRGSSARAANLSLSAKSKRWAAKKASLSRGYQWNPHIRVLTPQIIGFVLLAMVTGVIWIKSQGPISRLTLGFVLTALTQGFDFQKRAADSGK